MDRYNRDPRVARCGDGYAVNADGTTYHLLHSSTLEWGVYVGPDLTLAETPTGPAIGYADVEALIAALIGEPQD